jgi:crotonobetainyl-CoA:carnitine CoA-transferase CaiB-like acyl-CoA transferase
LNSELPLRGIRVLDVTVVWAGPYATMILGDLGAEVIRVESIGHFPGNTRGSLARPTREWIARAQAIGRPYVNSEPGERPWDRHGMFNSHARNKLSMTAELRKPEGREAFLRLLAVSDVLIENNSVDVMYHLGLTYEKLTRYRPDLIMVSMPSYGRTGPYRAYKGFGINAESLSGFTLLRGYPEDAPASTTGTYYMDGASGAGAASAILLALRHRRRTGAGQYIDFSQAENMLPHLGEALMDYALNGRTRKTLGNRCDRAAPQGAYRCAGENRWVALAVQDEAQWRALCGAIGRPEWAADRRFSTLPARLRRHDEIDAAIEEWTLTLKPREAARQLQDAGVPAGMITDNLSAFDDPQIAARGFFHRMTQREAGTHLYPGFLWKLSETPPRFRYPAPCLGEHNDYVYREVLGYTEEEIAGLEARDLIGEIYLEALPATGSRPG